MSKNDKWGHLEIFKYLEKYGYFHPFMEEQYKRHSLKTRIHFSTSVANIAELRDVLMLFQLNQGLDATGLFDAKTQEFFEKPRCGVPDYNVRGSHLGFRLAEGDVRYSIANNLPTMSSAQQNSAIREAFSYWENAGIPLRFSEAASPHLVIKAISGQNEFYGISDGQGKTLGVTVTPNLPIPIGFDAAERFATNQPIPSGSFDFVSVAAHEFGHSIGLGHSQVSGALMNAYYNGRRGLDQDDIATVKSLYPDWWGSSWQDMRGWVTSIAVGANGTVWTIGRDYGMFRWNEGGQHWEDRPFGGYGFCIAVTPDGRPWVIGGGDDGENNNIFEWDGNWWQARGGWGYDIAIGSRGDIYHVGRGGAIYKYTGVNQWSHVPGAKVYPQSPHGHPWGHSIAVHSDGGCWHIGAGQEIFRPSGGGWQGTGAFAYAIGAGPNGEMMSVGRGNKIWIWDGSRWVDGWSDVVATSVEIGPRGQCYHNGRDRGIFRRILR